MKNGFFIGNIIIVIAHVDFSHTTMDRCLYTFCSNHSNNSNFPTEICFPIFANIVQSKYILCFFGFFFAAFFYFHFFMLSSQFFFTFVIVLGSECTSPKALFISFYEYQKEGENLSITNFFHIHKMFSEKYFHHKNIWRKMHLGFMGTLQYIQTYMRVDFQKLKNLNILLMDEWLDDFMYIC